jgi:hypothetical protein
MPAQGGDCTYRQRPLSCPLAPFAVAMSIDRFTSTPDALGLHFPGIKDSNAPKPYVSYRLNRVALGELELDGDDLSDDDDED